MLFVRCPKWSVPLLVLLFCSSFGCSPKTGGLFGTVTFNGKTVTSGTVQAFLSDGSTRTSDISPEGAYKLTGLPEGIVKLGVSSPKQRAEPRNGKKPEVPSGEAGKALVRLPDELSWPEKSGLVATVIPGETQHDLTLTGISPPRLEAVPPIRSTVQEKKR